MPPAALLKDRPNKSNGTTLPATRTKAPTVEEIVDVPELETRVVRIPIVSRTPLLVHNWSQKAIRMMLDKQMGIASKGREKKDPFEDFHGSLYRSSTGELNGFPSPAFKACAVSAANSVELKMTQMKQAFHVNFYAVTILAEPLAEQHKTEWDNEYAAKLAPFHKLGIGMRSDIVRLESGVADIRFRGWFPEWRCELEVEYNPRMLTLAQLLNLFRSGGSGVGIGEWRPGSPNCRSGEFGRFDVQVK